MKVEENGGNYGKAKKFIKIPQLHMLSRNTTVHRAK